MISSLEVVAPLLHSLHAVQEIPIVCILVLFGICALLRVKVEWFENPKTVIRVEDARYGEAASIGLQNNALCLVKMVEN